MVVGGGVSDDGDCFQGWERDSSYPTGSPNKPVVPAAKPAVKLSVRMFSVGRGVGGPESPEGLEMLCAFLMLVCWWRRMGRQLGAHPGTLMTLSTAAPSTVRSVS